MSAVIAKPILRGNLRARLIKMLLINGAISIVAGYAYKKIIADPRKKAYIEFYKDYNAEAEADRLYKMGLIRGYRDNEDVPDNL